MAFRFVLIALCLSLTGCGDGSKTGSAGSTPLGEASAPQKDQGRVQISTRLKGTLYFNYAAPLESQRVMALDLGKKRYAVAADGINASVSKDTIAYVNYCSPLTVQLAYTDPDGFMSPLNDCVEAEIAYDSLAAPAISPDGKRIAILNHKMQGKPDNPADDEYGLRAMIGAYEYSAVQVFDLDGTVLAEFKDMGPATWTRDGRLILAGRGGDADFGLYKASKDLRRIERFDDGRVKGPVVAMDGHPKADRVAFVFNGQLFDISVSNGKPKRLHQHGHTLAGISYSPDGKKIAMISSDTLDEAIQMGGSGYPIFIYDNGDVHTIRLPFVVAGPLDWVD